MLYNKFKLGMGDIFWSPMVREYTIGPCGVYKHTKILSKMPYLLVFFWELYFLDFSVFWAFGFLRNVPVTQSRWTVYLNWIQHFVKVHYPYNYWGHFLICLFYLTTATNCEKATEPVKGTYNDLLVSGIFAYSLYTTRYILVCHIYNEMLVCEEVIIMSRCM